MESIPLVTPPSPNRAVSAGPQRNPMEDADSSLTRKRPRLDSGSASYRSMSAERILPSPSAQESIIAQPTTPKDVFPRTPVSGNSEAKIWEGTPSRVTINVRDAAVRGTPVEHTVSAARDPACCDSDNDELPHLSDPGAFHKPKPEPPLVVSSSSSPSRSPEIEVADVEDINQEPGHTKWRVLSSVPDANTLRNEIWASFPFSDRAHHLWESADEIARHMQEGNCAVTMSNTLHLLIIFRTNRRRSYVSTTFRVDHSLPRCNRTLPLTMARPVCRPT